MRVLITTDVVGGVWHFTHELAAGLLQSGNPVALVSFGGVPSPAQQQQCDLLAMQYSGQFRYEASSVPLEWMQDNEAAYRDGHLVLMRIAAEFGAGLLHSNQFCFGALPLDIPKVLTAHSDVLSWAEACRPEPLEDSAWLRQYRLLVSEGLAAADLIITPTQWMLDALARNFPTSVPREVIPNGRTLGAVSTEVRRLRAITAGRLWDEAKDLQMLNDVSSPLPIYAAGETRQEDAAVAVELGCVTHLGPLDSAELLRFFSESAMYICTSIYEPFGLAPLEAALCGCAVLARDIPSLREVWHQGALYFSDAAELSELLHRLHDHPDLLVDAQRRSRERAALFTAEQMVNSYVEQFTKALSQGKTETYA